MRIRKLCSVGAACLVVLLLFTSGLAAQQTQLEQGDVQVTIKLAGEDVEAAVSEALRHDTFTFPYFLDVAATGEKVELRGKVDTEIAKARVERVASRVEGVKTVDNRVTIDPNLWEKSDLEIKENVQKEMDWSPLVPSQKVIVQVADGIVILHGEVKDLRAVQSATANAVQGGAKKVVNNLKVKPHVNVTLGSPWRSLRARPKRATP